MANISFLGQGNSVSSAQLEEFQSELHLCTKLLVAKHFSGFDQINGKGAYKVDDWIWDNSHRFTLEISDMLDAYKD